MQHFMCFEENDLSLLWDNMWVFRVLDFEKYLSKKEQANIISTVCEFWCLVSSPEMVILVSSIFARGSADTAGQGQQNKQSIVVYLVPNKCQDIVDKRNVEQNLADVKTLKFSCISQKDPALVTE